jgi:shikimate kinase
MIVVLNGPLGVGKSTLAECLAESIEQCVMLDGDHLIAANPPFDDALEHLHSTIALLVAHHRRFGYHHFVINHVWRSPQDLADLRRRLGGDADIHCFLLTLPYEANVERIERRASARAISELEYERRTVLEEREELMAWAGNELGEPLEVDEAPRELADKILARIGAR